MSQNIWGQNKLEFWGCQTNYLFTYFTYEKQKFDQKLFRHESIDYIKDWSYGADMVIYPVPF